MYASKTGFTKKYASMLSEKLGVDIVDVKELPKVPKESEVLYLGWMKVGKVQGLQKMKGHKVVAVCGSGTGRSAEPSEEEVKRRNRIENKSFFYLRGGCRPLRDLKGMDKVMLSMFVKAMRKSAEKDERKKEAVEIIVHGFDGVKEENLIPVLKWAEKRMSSLENR
ncbi:flavodoxin family protein [Proteiniclasticum ruminis]|uniref:flavodoxin family protein n=1 Tax=Proteiniclasticum ruminis TaxID=398199 RepID=UPI001FA8BC84|nr:flavodoxin domain-containing protein [Proteiniclasticum ruminis]